MNGMVLADFLRTHGMSQRIREDGRRHRIRWDWHSVVASFFKSFDHELRCTN